MNLRKGILFFPALAATMAAGAQQASVRGTVRDADGTQHLTGVTVRLSAVRDTSYSFSANSDSAGVFHFDALRADSFRLRFSYVGAATYEFTFKLDEGEEKEFDAVNLPRKSTELEGVVITGRPPIAVQKADTLQFSATNLKVNPDASAEDMMRKVPGVVVEGGQVRANGEVVQKVTIDGKDFFGDDATAALRNLPAEIIDKIQVFDRLSEQAQLTGVDDGNTVRSINIVTKVNLRRSRFGRVYAGAGTDERGSALRYSAGGNATILHDDRRISIVGNFNNINQQNFSQQDLVGATASVRGGNRGGRATPAMTSAFSTANLTVPQQPGINTTSAFGINWSETFSKKVTLTASYFYNSTKNITEEKSLTDYFVNGKNAFDFTTDTVRANSTNTNHRLNLRLEWKVDSFNTMVFTPALTFQQNESERMTRRYFNYNTNSSGLLERYTGNRNTTDRDGNVINGSLVLAHRFRKRGRSVSATLTRNANDRSGDNYILTDDYRLYASRAPYDTTTRRYTDQNSGGWQAAANVVYSEPVSNRSSFQVNYNPTTSHAYADQQAWGYVPAEDKYSSFLPALSNDTRSRTDAQNAGLTYRYSMKDKNLSVGVNYQSTRLRSEQHFPVGQRVDNRFNIFLPSAQLRWKLSKSSALRFNYRANVNTPSVTQLQGVLNPGNPPLYSVGNPDLDPQYTHTLSGQYTFTNTAKGQLLVGNFFAQAANNYIASATFQPQQDSSVGGSVIEALSQLRKPVNLDGYRNLRLLVNYAIPVKALKSNLNFNAGYSWNRIPGVVNNNDVHTNNAVYSLGTVIASNISQYVDFTVSYTANQNEVRSSNKDARSALPQQYRYYQHSASVLLNLLSKTGWVLQTDATNQYFSGYAGNPSDSYTLWNMAVGRKFGKSRRTDVRFSVFDLLGQNQSIQRFATESYIENQTTEVLQRYFMLTVTYNLRAFGAK